MILHPELAKDINHDPVAVHEDATHWIPYLLLGGRPRQMTGRDGKPLRVPIDATREMLIHQLRGQTGVYELAQTDSEGRALEAACAYVSIDPDRYTLDPQQERAMRFDRLMGLCESLIDANRHSTDVLSEMNRELLSAHTALQRGANELIHSANQTTIVANGLDRDECEPAIDVDELGQRLSEAIEREPAPAKLPWYVHILNGPLGEAVANLFTALPYIMVGVAQPKNSPKGK